MKKLILFSLSLLLFVPLIANASLDKNLSYGLQSNSDVRQLQEFLISKGFLDGSPTGNFFSLTLNAVKAYQKSIKVSQSGYVGVLTRGAINDELATNLSTSNQGATNETSTTPPTSVPQATTNNVMATLQAQIALLTQRLQAMLAQQATTQQIQQNTTPLACSPSWQIGSWNTCQNGQQARMISDSNNCGIINGKPAITQSCTSPAPSCQSDTWECGGWDLCSASGNQTRSCTKTFDCPSINTPSPTSSQSCTPPVQTQTENSTLNISINVPVTTTNSAQVSWNTNIPSSAKVFLTLDNGSIQVIQSAAGYSTQHVVDVSNLKSDTQYSYTIEAISGTQLKKITSTAKTKWEDPYSDYIFTNTSPAVGSATQWQLKISIPSINRDIRLTKAVFRFSDEDAARLDTMQPCTGNVPFVFGYFPFNTSKHILSYPIQKIDKNTYTYTVSDGSYGASGISIPQQPERPLTLSMCKNMSTDGYDEVTEILLNRALMENIKMPMSEWIIMDQSNGKQVKTW